MSFVSRVRVGSESRSLHVAALASLAVAQPLLDLLGNAPEFLVAHDLGPAEILLVVLLLSAALPLACSLAVAVLARVHAATANLAAALMVSFFTTLVALYALKNLPGSVWVVAALASAVGVTAGIAYHRTSTVRSFTSWLAPAVVVVPLVFLLRPEVQSLIWPRQHETLQTSKSDTPIVFLVFDGLPLTALLSGDYRIDRERYPSFAALADQSTWYRNATTVSDYTQWAVPAMLTARYPQAGSLPIASDHPETLFTWLGSSHIVKAYEPISRLCPSVVCEHVADENGDELIDFGRTLSVAYLHTILPKSVEDSLPAIDEGWADGLPPSDTPGEVWLRGGDQSRRGQAVQFINAIEPDGAKPSLHFMQVLLPHTPLAYLPGGQRYGTERSLPGLLDTRDRWVDDEWAATQGYRRFLLQVGYVDTLLGQLLARLRQTNLYDRALIVVTSDHGGSFRASRRFRRFTDDTAGDVLPIPLFIKAPSQTTGVVSDRNVETVDILPTIADLLGVALPWTHNGVSAVGTQAPKEDKTVYHDDARRIEKLSATLSETVRAAVGRKLELFGAHGNPYLIPLTSPQRALIGRAVDELRVVDAGDELEFALDVHGDFSNVDIAGQFLPAHLTGRARWRNRTDPAVVAIAVNGVVRATTRAYTFEERGSHHTWSIVLPADGFRAGDNEVDVFVVHPSTPPVLHRTHFTHARPVDLLSNAAAYGLGVSHNGWDEREGRGEQSFRWTNGAATVSVPRRARPTARALRINFANVGPPDKALRIRANGCDVFDGKVPTGRSSRVFSLAKCRAGEEGTVIELRSDSHTEPSTGRRRGVAIERIDLLEQPWPALRLPESDRRSQIRLTQAGLEEQTLESTSQISAIIINRGASIWGTPDDLGDANGAVRVGVLWFPKGQTTSPAAVQRVELPRALVPGDSVDLRFQLVPMADGTRPLPAGEYEAWIGMMQEGVAWFYQSGDSVRKLRVVHNPRP